MFAVAMAIAFVSNMTPRGDPLEFKRSISPSSLGALPSPSELKGAAVLPDMTRPSSDRASHDYFMFRPREKAPVDLSPGRHARSGHS